MFIFQAESCVIRHKHFNFHAGKIKKARTAGISTLIHLKYIYNQYVILHHKIINDLI